MSELMHFIIIIYVIIIIVVGVLLLNTNYKESLDIMNNHIDYTPATSFCKSYLGNSADLETACNQLTQQKCNQTNCCVFSSKTQSLNGKCLAGDIQGPTYKTNKQGDNKQGDNKQGNKITTDTYYYQGKCYGNCPTH